MKVHAVLGAALAFSLTAVACESLDPVVELPASRSVVAKSTDTWPGVYDPFTVLSLNIDMDPANWDVIRFDTTNEIEVPATFYASGETPIAVTVRRKSSRALPSEANPIKVGLKVKVASGRWHGVTTLSLENGGDISPIAEGLAWNLHQMASVAGFYGDGYNAALASWVRVYLNGQYIGVYTSVEQRNKQFLRNRYGTNSGMWLYEVDDINGWELESGDPHSPTFTALCFSPFQAGSGGGGRRGSGSGTCPQPNDTQLGTLLEEHIDMQAMITEGAVDAFIENDDALFSHGKNFNFVDFDATAFPGRKRAYYPWDLDTGFRKVDGSIYGIVSGKTKLTQSPYEQVILNHPTYRGRFNSTMLALLDDASGPIAVGRIHAFLDAAKAATQGALAEDPYLYGGTDPFPALKSWVAARASSVRSQVAANQPKPR